MDGPVASSFQTVVWCYSDGINCHAGAWVCGSSPPGGAVGATARVACLSLDAEKHKQCLVTILPSVQDNLSSLAVPTTPVAGNTAGTSDLLHHSAVHGVWPQTEIRHTKPQAVFLVLQHFKPWSQGKHVLVSADNHTAVAYIIR